MSYTFRPQSGRNPDDFNMAAQLKPAQLDKVIAGIDGYAKTAETAAKDIFEPCLSKFASWGFKRFGIFETATKAEPSAAARVKWIKDLGEWINNRNNIELVSWFHSGVGPHAGPAGWFLGGRTNNNDAFSLVEDGSIAAYAQLLKP